MDSVPIPVVEATVRLLGRFDKDATRLGVIAAVAVAGAAVREPRARLAAGVGLSAVGAAVALRRPPRCPPAAVLGALVGAAVAAGAGRVHPAASVAAIGMAGGAVVQRRRQATSAEARSAVPSMIEDGAEGWDGATALITPTRDFYVTDVNLGPPPINSERHVLEITGDVEQPVRLEMAVLRAMEGDPFPSVLVCIHNRVGGRRLGNAVWSGVSLRHLADLVGVSTQARFVSTVAVDGFRATIPLELLRTGGLEAWVVCEMNGAPLPPAQGGPLRFLVPGLYGQYNGAKWLSRLEFHHRHPGDYWTPRGWPHGPAEVRPGSRLDPPRVQAGAAVLTGVAWAPPHGISQVDVLIDGSPVRAELAHQIDPRSWRRFRVEVALGTGPHRVASRAIPNVGDAQAMDLRPPFPTGATGLHMIEVVVP